METTFFVTSRFGWDVGDGRRSDSEGGEQRGPQEIAERPSQAPNGKRQATASPSSRNEHARSRASSMGVGVRGDAARSACWFRRLQALAGTCGNSPLGSNRNSFFRANAPLKRGPA